MLIRNMSATSSGVSRGPVTSRSSLGWSVGVAGGSALAGALAGVRDGALDGVLGAGVWGMPVLCAGRPCSCTPCRLAQLANVVAECSQGVPGVGHDPT